MPNKLMAYGLWTFGTVALVGVIGYVVLLNTFDIFDTPTKKVLSSICDHEGLRRAEVFKLDGNAVTNPSIQVSVYLDCDKYGSGNEVGKLVFAADDGLIRDNDVIIKWSTFDTLTIEYKGGIRIFTQLHNVNFPDSTLNIHVIYNEIE